MALTYLDEEPNHGLTYVEDAPKSGLTYLDDPAPQNATPEQAQASLEAVRQTNLALTTTPGGMIGQAYLGGLRGNEFPRSPVSRFYEALGFPQVYTESKTPYSDAAAYMSGQMPEHDESKNAYIAKFQDSLSKVTPDFAGRVPQPIEIQSWVNKLKSSDWWTGKHDPNTEPPIIKEPEVGAIANMTAGVQRSAAKTLGFFTSPEGIALLGTGALHPDMQHAVAAGFAIQMAMQAPDQVVSLAQSKNLSEATEHATDLLTTSGLFAMASAHMADTAAKTQIDTALSDAIAEPDQIISQTQPKEGEPALETKTKIEAEGQIPLSQQPSAVPSPETPPAAVTPEALPKGSVVRSKKYGTEGDITLLSEPRVEDGRTVFDAHFSGTSRKGTISADDVNEVVSKPTEVPLASLREVAFNQAHPETNTETNPSHFAAAVSHAAENNGVQFFRNGEPSAFVVHSMEEGRPAWKLVEPFAEPVRGHDGILHSPEIGFATQEEAIASALKRGFEVDPEILSEYEKTRGQSAAGISKQTAREQQPEPSQEPGAPLQAEATGGAGQAGKRVRISIPDSPTGVPDLIDFVKEQGGIKLPRKGERTQEHDDVSEETEAFYNGKLVGTRGKISADEMAQMAADAGLIKSPTPPELWSALHENIVGRPRTREMARQMQRKMVEEEKQARKEVATRPSGIEVIFDSGTIDATESLRDRFDTKRRTAHVFKFPDDKPQILYRGISEQELKSLRTNPTAEIMGGKYSSPIEREFGAQYALTPEEAVRAAFHDEQHKGVKGQPKYLLKVDARGKLFSHLDPRPSTTPELAEKGRYVIPAERISGDLGVSTKIPFKDVLEVVDLGTVEKAARARFGNKAKESPTLRTGEKQGDLLSRQTEDLALVGEKGVDYAAREAERIAAETASAEAKAAQEKQQTKLFEKSSAEAPAQPTKADVEAQAARIDAIVQKAVDAGKDRIEAENEAHRIVDSANAAGKPVPWNDVERFTLSKESTQKRGGYKTVSTEQPVSAEGKQTFGEKAASEAATPAEESQHAEVRAAVDALKNPQHKTVVQGFLDGKTPKEIANEMGVSEQRISIIKQDAFATLRASLGPGAASAFEQLSIGSEASQLAEIVRQSVNTKTFSDKLTDLTRTAQNIPDKVSRSIAHSVAYSKLWWENFVKRPSTDDFARANGDNNASREVASFESMRMSRALESKHPRWALEAIPYWIEAAGDESVLRQQLANAKTKALKTKLSDALKLSDEQKTLAVQMENFFDLKGQEMQDAGLLSSMLENYVNRIWEKEPEFAQGVVNDVHRIMASGKLETSFRNARKRVIGSLFEGEQLGKKPTTTNIAKLAAQYNQHAGFVMADRGYVRALTEGKTVVKINGKDMEMPLVKASGLNERRIEQPSRFAVVTDDGSRPKPFEKRIYETKEEAQKAVGEGQHVEERKQDVQLSFQSRGDIDPQFYMHIDHPALKGWSYVKTGEDGTTHLYRGDLWVHKSVALKLKNQLSKSALYEIPGVRAITKAQGFLKQSSFAASLFHPVQIGMHVAGEWVNPFHIPEIDVNDSIVQLGLRRGLKLTNYDALRDFGVGSQEGGWVKHVPFAGEVNTNLTRWLFEDYIPRATVAIFKDAYAFNTKRLANRGYTPEQIAEISANQSNAATGSLNFRYMGRNPTLQHFAQLTMVAPTFFESRARIIGQAVRPGGSRQLRTLLTIGLGSIVAMKVVEELFSDKVHWDKPFSATIGNREYKLRSVPADLYEAIADPNRYFNHRLAAGPRALMEFFTKRDATGQPVDWKGQAVDAANNLLPISARKRRDVKWWEGMMDALGLHTKRYSELHDIKGMAAEWNKKNGRPVESGFAPSKYLALRNALEDNDKKRVQTAYDDLFKSEGGNSATHNKITKGFTKSMKHAFTGGNRHVEKRFRESLSKSDKELYDKATEKRDKVLKRFNDFVFPKESGTSAGGIAPSKSSARTIIR